MSITEKKSGMKMEYLDISNLNCFEYNFSMKKIKRKFSLIIKGFFNCNYNPPRLVLHGFVLIFQLIPTKWKCQLAYQTNVERTKRTS